jgi:hypothetical protein
MLCPAKSGASNTTNVDTPVFQGFVELNKDGRSFSYAFAAGDNVVIKIETEKKNELRNARLVSTNGEVIWSRDNTKTFSAEIPIIREGVYTFTVDKKGLFNQKVGIDIVRKSGSLADFNTAFRKHNIYLADEVKYQVDLAVGYQPAQYNMQEFKVFNKYYFENVNLYEHREQVKGNLAMDGNHARGFAMGIKPDLVPADAKFKCYTYSLNAVLGGQKHWAIAELTAQIGGAAASIFLTPAAGFAVHGAMALVGPAPNKAPVLYYMSNRHSDIKTVGEIKSNTNKAANAANMATGALATGLGFVSGKAARAVRGATQVDTKDEGDLDFTQKGNVTNLFVTSAIPPSESYFIMTNSYLAHAKNIHLSATALYYFPTFFTVQAQQEEYKLSTVQVPKTETKHEKVTTLISIRD